MPVPPASRSRCARCLSRSCSVDERGRRGGAAQHALPHYDSLGTSDDPDAPLAVPPHRAAGARHHPRLVADLPCDTGRRGGAPGRGALARTLARAVLLASASALLRQVPGRATCAWTHRGLAHQPLGGRGARRHDGAALRRGGHPRLIHPHGRTGSARLLPGARPGRHLPGHHSRRSARAALRVQARRAAALADVRPADSADGIRRLARLARQVGQVRDPRTVFPHRDRHRPAFLCAAGHRRGAARALSWGDGGRAQAALRCGTRGAPRALGFRPRAVWTQRVPKKVDRFCQVSNARENSALACVPDEECVARNLELLRSATACDCAFLAPLNPEDSTIGEVKLARSAFAQCRPEGLTGIALASLPWLKGRLEHLRLSELRDTSAPRKEQTTEAAKLAELHIGSTLLVALRVQGKPAGFLGLAPTMPRGAWDVNLT